MDHSDGPGGGSRRNLMLAGIALAIVVAAYALLEHASHVFGALPYLLLLACPLLHVFGHGHGHGHGHGGNHAASEEHERTRP